jgi:hypothetical protein
VSWDGAWSRSNRRSASVDEAVHDSERWLLVEARPIITAV